MTNPSRVCVLLCVLAVLLAVCTQAFAEAGPRAMLMKVNHIVKVRPSGGTWRQATLPQNRYLWPRDEVLTHQHSSARVSLDGATLSLGPLSHVVIPAARAQKPSVRTLLQVIKGKLLILLIGARPIEIGTAGATASARGTKFLVDVDDAGMTVLTVVEGAVDFYNDLGTVLVSAGEQSTAGPGKAPTRPMRVDPSTFIDWEASPDAIWLGFEKSARPVTDTKLTQAYDLLADGRNREAAAAFAAAGQTDGLQGESLAGQAVAALGTGGDAAGLAAKAVAAAPQDANVAVMAGFATLRAGQMDPAVAALQKAMQLDAKDPRAAAYLSLARLAQGDGKAALELASTATKAGPGSALAHQALASAAFYAGSLDQAAAESAAALELSQDDAAGQLLASQVAAAQGDLPRALQRAEIAVTLDPNLAPAFQMLGILSLAMNDVARAEKAFRHALELQPKLAAAQTGLGQVLARQDKFQEALQAQQAAVSLDPGAAAAHMNLGAVLMQTGRLQEAQAEYDAALDRQPDWAMIHANKALAYLEANEYADAVREGEEAVRLGDRSARTRTTMARTYLKQDRVNKAWAELRQALEYDPNYALARLHLAEVYGRLGLNREANSERLQALAHQPSAMVDSRNYARSEVAIAGGDGAAVSAFTSGRGDGGQNAYYLAAAAEKGDWDRWRTDYYDQGAVALFGRQTSPDNTVVIAGTYSEDDRDIPGMVDDGSLLPTDVDYRSNFKAGDIQVVNRLPLGNDLGLTWRAGYQWNLLQDRNPDSDPTVNPIRLMRLEASGPMAEVRFDQKLGFGEALVAGAAWYAEDREISGTMSAIDPGTGDTVITPFENTAARTIGSGYADWEKRLNDRTWLLLGGRAAVANDAEPVLRPRLRLRYKPAASSTITLLTRPMLADDVSMLAPVDEWSSRFFLSPLNVDRGGFVQSYEAQFEMEPDAGSLARVTLFQRDARNMLVNMEDPAWAVGVARELLGQARVRGVEAEYERWLCDHLSAGLWVRWTQSENGDLAGDPEVPYQPEWAAQGRLDYMDDAGWRANLTWNYIGRRFANMDNSDEMDSFSTLNLSVARQLDLRSDVFVTVTNLLDEEYEFYRGYPERGVRVTGGFRHRF